MAPANFGPENFAINKMIAVTTAEAKLFKIISIYVIVTSYKFYF